MQNSTTIINSLLAKFAGNEDALTLALMANFSEWASKNNYVHVHSDVWIKTKVEDVDRCKTQELIKLFLNETYGGK